MTTFTGPCNAGAGGESVPAVFDPRTIEERAATTARNLRMTRARTERVTREQEQSDLERYETTRTAPFVGAAMRAFHIIGNDAEKAVPLHHEVPLAILEKQNGQVTFMFHRKYGHWSERGVRMVDLEMLPQPDGAVYRITGEVFMSRPENPERG
jgi:hypothetical protein